MNTAQLNLNCLKMNSSISIGSQNVATRRPIVYISRTEIFSACHRLHSSHLTDKENLKIFGKCNNENGHGHNYKVEVILRGEVDPETGMVMNLVDLKDCIDDCIMKTMDHKHLDKDVEYFKKVTSTAENIAVYVWTSLRSSLPKPELLYEIKIHETDKNVAFYRGELS